MRLRRAAATAGVALSDEAIAHACAAGDPAAIAELFDRFQARVARCVHRMLGGGSDVEDLVQSTFLEIARGKNAYDGRAGVLTWLLSVAANLIRHHRRAYARRSRLTDALAQQGAPSVPSPEARSDARLSLERAQALLSGLDDELRDAFVLCDLEGVAAREAAAILGLSEAAVWQRASRARKAIRAQLGGRLK